MTAIALAAALLAANVAVCAGWAATPEARMACCTDSDVCPMHAGNARGAGDMHAVSQAQADSCCAASERQQSSQSLPLFSTAISSAVLGASVIVAAPVPAHVARDAWRTVLPVPLAPIPRHVLFSVFLV